MKTLRATLRFIPHVARVLWANLLAYNFALKAVSVLVAMVIWLIVIGSRKVELTKEVPLQILKAADVVIANEIPDRVTFRLSGPKAFLRGLVDRPDVPIKINLSAARPGLVTYRLGPDNLRLPLGVEMISVHPTSVLIKLENAVEREVPIHLSLTGAPREGRQVYRAKVDPETIRVRGPETVLEALQSLATAPIDLSKLPDGVSETRPRFDLESRGLSLPPESQTRPPVARFDVRPTQANRVIRDVEVKVLSDRPAEVLDPKLTLYFRLEDKDAREMKGLNRSKITVEVDLRNRIPGRYRELPRILLPKELSLVRTVPEFVRVNLR
jgi:hypothetical protein